MIVVISAPYFEKELSKLKYFYLLSNMTDRKNKQCFQLVIYIFYFQKGKNVSRIPKRFIKFMEKVL